MRILICLGLFSLVSGAGVLFAQTASSVNADSIASSVRESAVELAFRDPNVDTIYLLTDGQPSAGRIINVDDLADQVQRWNYSRQIVVHGISVGLDSKLLQRLARESGGQYVYVR